MNIRRRDLWSYSPPPPQALGNDDEIEIYRPSINYPVAAKTERIGSKRPAPERKVPHKLPKRSPPVSPPPRGRGMSERQFAISGRWALAADSLQWMLQRRAGQRWQSVSFVSSTRDVLLRCMREKGCPPADAERL